MRFKLFSLFLLVSFLCYSQERKDGDFGSYTIKQAQSPLVTNIVGWAYDGSFKKWAGYKNLIMSKYKSGNNKTPLQASMYDMGDYSLDNILSMKFKSVVVNSVQYYALYIVRWEHYYDYPEIFTDSHYYKDTYIYLFAEEEYNKLFDLPDTICKINITTSNYSRRNHMSPFRQTKEREYFELTAANLTSKRHCGWFYVKKEGDSYVRFQFPEKYLYVKEEVTKEVKDKYLYSTVEFEKIVCDFSKGYFELPMSAWKSLRIK